MPNIRIKDIPTTASATSSTDFIGIDGSANGTRKLNAFSPTFGGNLTVSGYADLGSGGIGTPAAGHIQIGGSGSYGAAIIGRGSAYDFGLFNKNGDDVIHVATGTTNVAVSGNLTVSGRDLTLGSSESVIYFGTPSANYLYYNGSSLFLRVGSVDRITIPASTGNFLIGTTTDGGQKLQVNGTAAITGQIRGANIVASNLGTADTGFYGTAGADAGSAHRLALVRTDTPTGGSALLSAFGAAVVEVNATSGINTGTRALTIDTSANATFAGNTTAKGTTHYFGADNSQRIELTSNNGSSQGLVEFYNRGTSAYFAARYLASSHTFEQGPIAINNTVQTAAAVASTHKVTISIGGTTYYLLATNV